MHVHACYLVVHGRSCSRRSENRAEVSSTDGVSAHGGVISVSRQRASRVDLIFKEPPRRQAQGHEHHLGKQDFIHSFNSLLK